MAIPKRSVLAAYSQGVLLTVLFVIAWGAYVRATGSGDGCGQNWPTCDGQRLFHTAKTEALIEGFHRLTSGMSFIMVIVQWLGLRKVLPKTDIARRAAGLSVVLMVVEVLIGAGLVLLRMVADNTAPIRGLWASAHLLNTFLLLAALSWVVFALRHPTQWTKPRPHRMALLAVGWLGMMVVGITGSISALGDTLFPATHLAEGWAADWSSTSHIFVRLRIYHPIAAALTGAYLMGLSIWVVTRVSAARRNAWWLFGWIALEVCVGVLNLVALAPVGLQLLHLVIADATWIALNFLSARLLTTDDTASLVMTNATQYRALSSASSP